jgi:UDP-2-acetamido-2-deoxy-ribo-hexuluronate aminotransferase
MTGVPFFNIAQTFSSHRDAFRQALTEALDTPDIANSPAVEGFENWVKGFTGSRHAIAVGNATDALSIMLIASGIGAGDEVIVPTYSFVASATSVVHAGATPVFVDIGPRHYGLEVSQIESLITPRTRAIMPVHLFSQTADMEPVMEIARRHDLLVLEDSAEGIGMWWDGIHAGCIGDAGVLSFFPTKTLGAFGDGGMILTNNDEIAAACLELRSLGLGKEGRYSRFGFDSRMDAIQAAVLMTRARLLESEIRRRADIAAQYSRALSRLAPHVEVPTIAERNKETRGVWYVYLIECANRDGLAHFLTTNGVGVECYYPTPFHLQPCFSHLGYQRGDFPNAEAACQRALGLPMYPDLTDSDVATVCAAIEAFYV